MIVRVGERLVKGFVKYALGKEGAQVVYSNMITGDIEDIEKDLTYYTVQKYGYPFIKHVIMSLPTGYTAPLEKWEYYYREFMNFNLKDIEKFPAFVVKHVDDETHEHVHVLLSCVSCEFEPFALSHHPLKVQEHLSRIAGTHKEVLRRETASLTL